LGWHDLSESDKFGRATATGHAPPWWKKYFLETASIRGPGCILGPRRGAKPIPESKPIEGIKKMKYAPVRVLAAGPLRWGAPLISAPSPRPPHLLRIFREDIKSGKSSAHEKVESAYARAFSKSGYTNYLALDGTTGTSQAWFLESYDSYESLEKAMHMAEAEPLKSTLSQLDAQDGELRTGERNMIATYQKDMSYLPVPSSLVKARFVNINMVRVRP